MTSPEERKEVEEMMGDTITADTISTYEDDYYLKDYKEYEERKSFIEDELVEVKKEARFKANLLQRKQQTSMAKRNRIVMPNKQVMRINSTSRK